MGQFVLGAVVGILVGVLGAVVYTTSRARRLDGDVARDRAQLDAERLRTKDLEATIARERDDHSKALSQLEDRFKVLADEALTGAVTSFREGQEDLFKAREAALDERLSPLDKQLEEYQRDVRELDEARQRAMIDVNNSAQRLEEAQTRVLTETTRLNTILGRASHRGRWGEVQLQRILELSGMQNHVDFETQETVSGVSDERQRPDVVVKLPKGASIAIDSKVPFDAFDRAMSATDDAAREAALGEYAAAVRGHVNELKRKSYFAALEHSPEFVVCFVPSDFLISAAFEADPKLLEDALESRVLVAGPTTLLGLLWSAYVGWSQFEAVSNIEEIQTLAERLVDRTSTLYGHLGRLGRSIDQSTKHFNGLVGSMESQLLVTVRDIQRHGLKSKSDIVEIDPLTELPRPLDERRWPAEISDGSVLDAEVLDAPELTSGLIDEVD